MVRLVPITYSTSRISGKKKNHVSCQTDADRLEHNVKDPVQAARFSGCYQRGQRLCRRALADVRRFIPSLFISSKTLLYQSSYEPVCGLEA